MYTSEKGGGEFESVEEIAPQVSWRKTKLSLCGICLAAYFSAENGYFYYCTAMLQYLEIHLSAVEATQVTSVLSLAYTIGPLITALVSLKLQPDYIISYHFVFLVSGWSIIFFFQENITMIYVGSAILGWCCSKEFKLISKLIFNSILINYNQKKI